MGSMGDSRKIDPRKENLNKGNRNNVVGEAEKEHNPISVDLFYGLGTLGSSTIGFVISSWLLYFYVPPDGSPLVPVALYGIAILVGRGISALITPFVGYLSDNSHNQWGRRLPFMFGAALPLLGVFLFLWLPPLQVESFSNLVYLVLMTIAYRIALVFYQVPYQALLPEIAITDRHRVRISAWQSGFLLIGMMLGGLAGPLIERQGYFITALVYSGAVLLIFYLPFLVLRERSGRQIAIEARIGFRESLAITFKNRDFVIFVIVWTTYLMTASFVQAAAPFIVTEVCLLSKADTIYFYIPGILASLAWYPVVTWLAKRWGKWKVYAGSLLASVIVFPGTMLIGAWFPVPLKFQCSSWAVLQAVVISGVVVLSSAFVAEITDYDYAQTGQRREGMYYAAMSVLDQIFSGIVSVLLPLILLLGRSHTLPQGAIGVRLTGVVGGLLMLIGFLVFLRYPHRNSQIM